MVYVHDLNEAAQAAATFVGECLFHRHRGVLDCGDMMIIFGNDGYATDERSKQEVEQMRGILQRMDLPVNGFATDEEGCSWAMVVQNYQGLPIDPSDLEAKLWEIWNGLCRS